jgi:hypothetical protein
MIHVASTNFASEKPVSSSRSDLSAATGIVTGVAISAGLWVAIGFLIHAVTG